MTRQDSNRSTFVVTAAIFVLALVARLIYLVALGSEPRLYDSLFDQVIYVDMAKRLLAGMGFSLSTRVFVADPFVQTSIQPPLYPLFVAAVFGAFGDNLLAIRVAHSIIGALTCVVVFLLGRQLFSLTIGVVSGVIASLYLPLIMYVQPIMSEIVFVFLIAVLVLIMAYSLNGTRVILKGALLGGVVALASLTRPEVFALTPLFVLTVLIRKLTQRVTWTRTALSMLVAAVVFGAIVAPWMWRYYTLHGEFSLVPNKRWGMWETNWLRYAYEERPDLIAACAGRDPLECVVPDFEGKNEIERDKYLSGLAQDFILNHPLKFVKYGVSRLLMSYPLIPREFSAAGPEIGSDGLRIDGYDPTSLDDFPAYTSVIERVRLWEFRALFVLSLIGVTIGVTRHERNVWLPLAVIMLLAAVTVVTHGKERVRLTSDPYLIILASYGLVAVYQRIRERFEVWT